MRKKFRGRGKGEHQDWEGLKGKGRRCGVWGGVVWLKVFGVHV